jgi:hypothetical protein
MSSFPRYFDKIVVVQISALYFEKMLYYVNK